MTRAGGAAALITVVMMFGACGGDDTAAPTGSGVVIATDVASDAETTAPPTIPVLAPDQELTPETPYLIELNTHCGVRIISQRINGKFWTTDEATAAVDWMPAGWPRTGLRAVVILAPDSTFLTVTYAGRSVIYRPTELAEGDLCA